MNTSSGVVLECHNPCHLPVRVAACSCANSGVWGKRGGGTPQLDTLVFPQLWFQNFGQVLSLVVAVRSLEVWVQAGRHSLTTGSPSAKADVSSL